jgi:pilus assembly protein Flp/PilA
MLLMAQNLYQWLRARDERGATAVEYGMIVALIAAIIVGTVAALGVNVNDAFDTVNKGF